MKKFILLLITLMVSNTSLSGVTSNGEVFENKVTTLWGVDSVNGHPVNYIERPDDTPEGFLAKVGLGTYAGTCYHNGDRYADVKGTATCPGYHTVFPNEGGTISLKYDYITVYVIVGGSPACEETATMHDPWN